MQRKDSDGHIIEATASQDALVDGGLFTWCFPGTKVEGDTVLSVFCRLSRDSLFEGFVRYLTVRIADQQQVIANLVTVDSEQRLG